MDRPAPNPIPIAPTRQCPWYWFYLKLVHCNTVAEEDCPLDGFQNRTDGARMKTAETAMQSTGIGEQAADMLAGLPNRISHVFRQHGIERPHHVALTDLSESWTYGELGTIVADLAPDGTGR